LWSTLGGHLGVGTLFCISFSLTAVYVCFLKGWSLFIKDIASFFILVMLLLYWLLKRCARRLISGKYIQISTGRLVGILQTCTFKSRQFLFYTAGTQVQRSFTVLAGFYVYDNYPVSHPQKTCSYIPVVRSCYLSSMFVIARLLTFSLCLPILVLTQLDFECCFCLLLLDPDFWLCLLLQEIIFWRKFIK
jgi:hypothetical protein